MVTKTYKVLKIQELTRPSDTGELERYYRHTIKTMGGTILTVDIDADDFTEEKARPILENRAVAADRILNMQG